MILAPSAARTELGKAKERLTEALRSYDNAALDALPDTGEADGWRPISHEDACRLSRVFNKTANLGDAQDYRINEWLKRVIVAALPPPPNTGEG